MTPGSHPVVTQLPINVHISWDLQVDFLFDVFQKHAKVGEGLEKPNILLELGCASLYEHQLLSLNWAHTAL